MCSNSLFRYLLYRVASSIVSELVGRVGQKVEVGLIQALYGGPTNGEGERTRVRLLRSFLTTLLWARFMKSWRHDGWTPEENPHLQIDYVEYKNFFQLMPKFDPLKLFLAFSPLGVEPEGDVVDGQGESRHMLFGQTAYAEHNRWGNSRNSIWGYYATVQIVFKDRTLEMFRAP